MALFEFILNDPEYVPDGGGTVLGGSNFFYPISEEQIFEAEKKLGHCFPEDLRQFYQKIGYGRFVEPKTPSPDYQFYSTNEILPPMVAARFAKGELIWEGQQNWMSESSYELLQPGDLPFFEIGDSTDFMVVKPLSDNPNAVWYMGAEKIEDSLERFIYNLYFDDPAYYMRNW
jgi:hypothetical protein